MKLESLVRRLLILGIGISFILPSACKKETPTNPSTVPKASMLLQHTPEQIINHRSRYLNSWGRFSNREYIVDLCDDGGCCFLAIGESHAEISKTFVPNLKIPVIREPIESKGFGIGFIRHKAVLTPYSPFGDLRDIILSWDNEKGKLHWLSEDIDIKVQTRNGTHTYIFSRYMTVRRTGNYECYPGDGLDEFESLDRHLETDQAAKSRRSKRAYRLGHRIGRTYRRQIDQLADVIREATE